MMNKKLLIVSLCFMLALLILPRLQAATLNGIYTIDSSLTVRNSIGF